VRLMTSIDINHLRNQCRFRKSAQGLQHLIKNCPSAALLEKRPRSLGEMLNPEFRDGPLTDDAKTTSDVVALQVQRVIEIERNTQS